MDVLRRCGCADKPNDTAQAVMLAMLVSRFCKALGEPIPEDAIRRAEQLAGAVELLREVADSGAVLVDDRLSWVEVQIDRETWGALALRTAAGGSKP